MRMMAVDTFFKTPTLTRLNDDFDHKPNKTSRRCISSLTMDEASDMFGISSKDDSDLRKRIFEKYNKDI